MADTQMSRYFRTGLGHIILIFIMVYWQEFNVLQKLLQLHFHSHWSETEKQRCYPIIIINN